MRNRSKPSAAPIEPQKLQQLHDAARRASEAAYCVYSDFAVGAAVLGANGKIYHGCNVENAAYALTVCAERNAICQMVADGCREITAIALYTPTRRHTTPCGSCRQVIGEFGMDAIVICLCDGSEPFVTSLLELLPYAFRLENP